MATRKKTRQLCIGIVTNPSITSVHGRSFIGKAITHWFESNRIRVVPIPYDTTEHESYFQQINGLCIADNRKGDSRINPTFFRTLTWFVTRSMTEYFPIWAECFGYELLMFIIGHFRGLNEYNVTNMLPIHPVHPSRLFHSFPASYHAYLHQPTTKHDHLHGISPDDFMKRKRLREFFHIVATSIDKKGHNFVALIEAKQYPMYGIAFHPHQMKQNRPFIQFIRSELQHNPHHCFAPYVHHTTVPHRVDSIDYYFYA